LVGPHSAGPAVRIIPAPANEPEVNKPEGESTRHRGQIRQEAKDPGGEKSQKANEPGGEKAKGRKSQKAN